MGWWESTHVWFVRHGCWLGNWCDNRINSHLIQLCGESSEVFWRERWHPILWHEDANCYKGFLLHSYNWTSSLLFLITHNILKLLQTRLRHQIPENKRYYRPKEVPTKGQYQKRPVIWTRATLWQTSSGI